MMTTLKLRQPSGQIRIRSEIAGSAFALGRKNFSPSARQGRGQDGVCRANLALLAPQPVPDCGLEAPTSRSRTLLDGRAASTHATKMQSNRGSPVLLRETTCGDRPFDRNGQPTSMTSGARIPLTRSHFSAVLDQHYLGRADVQFVCVFQSSRDEDALRFAWGSSAR